jgi:hypothetical protein
MGTEIDLTTDPSSKLTPAITVLNNIPYIAWTALDEKIYLGAFGGDGPGAFYIKYLSEVGVALANDGTRLFIGWVGKSDNDLRVTTATLSGEGFDFSTKEIGQSSPHTPALAYFNSNLFMAFTGNSGAVYVLNVATDKVIKVDTGSNGGPSLAVYKDRLYIGYPKNDNSFYFQFSADGTDWGVKPLLST